MNCERSVSTFTDTVLYSRLPGDAGDSEQLVGGAGKAEVRQTRRLVRVTCEASGTRGVISAREDTAQHSVTSLLTRPATGSTSGG